MPLSAGKRLGSYEILAIVGVGGMGEVYKARDTRLDRIVAIKVLPDHVAGDPESRSRFEREAKAISSLSHAHICTLHDVGSDAGVDFLVMEYLEGETAAQRVAKGPLPVQQVLRCGVEIAEALDRAHRQGIVHRDLKPGNVMLTKSGVKLLDFGLAKLRPAALERGAGSAPTAAADLTGDGTILGTLQYMAPEQVEGKAVDYRADIFSLGAILYELATAKKAFDGASRASLIGAILRDEPRPISELQPLSPPALDALVVGCLAKEPDERWQSAADVARQLRFMQTSGSSVQAGGIRGSTRRSTPLNAATSAIGMLLLGAALAFVAVRNFSRPAPVPAPLVSRFTIAPPDSAVLTNSNPIDLAVSRDGKRVAYFATIGEKTSLYVRDLDRLESRAVTEVPTGGVNPVFSPDGESIVFNSGGEGLVRVAVDGALRSRVADESIFGAAWGPDGTLVYSDGPTLYATRMGDATPEPLTRTPDSANGPPPIYAAPTFLPGGRRVLFTVVAAAAGTERVGVIDLDTREQHAIVEGAHPFFERSGYLVFVRNTTLMAVPFDPERLTVLGPAVSVLQGVRHPNIASAVDYSLSENGTLVYVPAAEIAGLPRGLVWIDRSGRTSGRAVSEPVDGARDPRLAPDGRRLLLTAGPQQAGHLWVYDLAGSPPVPLITEGDNGAGIWSRDGKRVTFLRSGLGAGFYGLHSLASDGSERAPQEVPTGTTISPPDSWTSRGDLVLSRLVPSADIVVLRNGEQTVRDLVATPYAEAFPALSPNERWLAYASNRTGRAEIWAMRYPDGNSVRVSNGGGIEPRWSRDGRELYFRQGDSMMAVAVNEDAEQPFSAVTKLFERPALMSTVATANSWTYDVASDGRFLMIDSGAPTDSAEGTIVVVQNWTEELKRRIARP